MISFHLILSTTHTCSSCSTSQTTEARPCLLSKVLKGKADAMTSVAAKLSSFCPKTLAAGIKFAFAILRTTLNSTFSGCLAFNESFAPLLLYQDGVN